MIAETEIDLYVGDSRPALDRVAQHRQLAKAAGLQHIFLVRAPAMYLEGRCAIALAMSGADGRKYLNNARRAAKQLRNEHTVWTDSLATLLEAGLKNVEGRGDEVIDRLTVAMNGFDRIGMSLHSAAARRCRAKVIGGEIGASEIDEIDRWMVENGVHNPVRLTEMLAPGFVN